MLFPSPDESTPPQEASAPSSSSTASHAQADGLTTSVSRRDFVKLASAAGLLLGVQIP
ncbi:MAG: hypothetical protein JWN48_5971, partial [Myxococcaceae bacterium]|nr:hypothetical protein [Myxococcaceae bacterium]